MVADCRRHERLQRRRGQWLPFPAEPDDGRSMANGTRDSGGLITFVSAQLEKAAAAQASTDASAHQHQPQSKSSERRQHRAARQTS